MLEPRVPAAKGSGVVKVCVTSTKKSALAKAGEMRLRKTVCDERSGSSIKTQTDGSHRRKIPGWRGAGVLRHQWRRGCQPRTLFDDSSRFGLGEEQRREWVCFAGGRSEVRPLHSDTAAASCLRKSSCGGLVEGACYRLRRRPPRKAAATGRICRGAEEVGRGVGQGYFADTRGIVGSNPTGEIIAMAERLTAPIVPDRRFPSSSF
jgi:hypothetical protein